MKQIVLTVVLGLTSLQALAAVVAVPEPDALSLLAVGAVGGLLVWMRNRGKK
jgi:PEP-CTERM motif